MDLDKIRKHQAAKGMTPAAPHKPPKPKQKEKPPQKQQKKKKKTRKPLPTPEEHDARLGKKPRLPNGAMYRVEWCEKSGMWAGFLRIWNPTGDCLEFRSEATGVFRLLHVLDEQYRTWLKESQLRKSAVETIAPEPASPTPSEPA